jgi:hypothetical protein
VPNSDAEHNNNDTETLVVLRSHKAHYAKYIKLMCTRGACMRGTAIPNLGTPGGDPKKVVLEGFPARRRSEYARTGLKHSRGETVGQ